MLALLTGVTFILWGLQLLGIAAISPVILGLFALVTGVVWVASGWVAIPTFAPKRG